MGLFKKFPEIRSLHKVTEDIFRGQEVVVTEKIHGRNSRFGWVDGRFRVGGHSEEFELIKSGPSTGEGYMGWIRESGIAERTDKLARELGAEIIFYGEWFGRGVQKGVKYFEAEKGFRIFDVRINEEFVGWDEVVRLAGIIDLPLVPLLYRGVPSQEVFDELRLRSSTVAHENGVGSEGNLAEGIVIKPTTMHRNHEGGEWVMAKHKHPKFEERKSMSLYGEKERPPTPAEAPEFVEEFFTAMRLEHVIDKIREQGVDISAPKAIGLTIRGMYEDVVLKEAIEEFAALSKEARDAVDSLHAKTTKRLLEAYLKSENE